MFMIVDSGVGDDTLSNKVPNQLNKTKEIYLSSYKSINQPINQLICHETQYMWHRCYCTDRNNQAKKRLYGSPK